MIGILRCFQCVAEIFNFLVLMDSFIAVMEITTKHRLTNGIQIAAHLQKNLLAQKVPQRENAKYPYLMNKCRANEAARERVVIRYSERAHSV